jgi:aminoglycoside phosphotransferase (APT) family kinase protein
MELAELTERLVPFCREHLGDPAATVSEVYKMPGHAGFAYGFTAHARGEASSYYLRLPPPNVRLEGTADVMRQVRMLRLLRNSKVPVAPLVWWGEDPRWFGRPYFATEKLEGDTLRFDQGEWGATLTVEQTRPMARQAMAALAEIHRIDWERDVPELGPPLAYAEDVTRWDRFLARAAEPQFLDKAPLVREKLLEKVPAEARIGVFHGDFQWTNLFFSWQGKLLAVIDWELVNIGACLNDVGWICAFTDPAAWDHPAGGGAGHLPAVEELIAYYAEAWGSEPPDLSWFRALATYKFGIITGLNLMLHRTGKREDPHWELLASSMRTNMGRALELLG